MSSLAFSALKILEGIKWFCLAPADSCIAESNAGILRQNYLREENAETFWYNMKSNLKLLIIQSDIKCGCLKTSLFCLVSDYSREFSLIFSLLIRKQAHWKAKELCPADSKGTYKIIEKEAILLKKNSKFRKSIT